MKFTLSFLLFVFMISLNAQNKNYIDQPYVETTAVADTIVKPDLIYLDIILNESDSKNKISIEQQENAMADALTALGVDLKTQLSLSDLSSNFKKYFLKQKDILKSKTYKLKVFDAQTAGKVIVALENIGISNVSLDKAEYSKIEELKLDLREKAMIKAKKQAEKMLKPLNQNVVGALIITDSFSSGNYDDGMELNEIVVMAYSKNKKAELEPIEIEFKPIKVSCKIHTKLKIE